MKGGDDMKKLFLMLVTMSFILVFGSICFVLGNDLPTTITVGEQTIVFTVNPPSLDFPPAIAGTTSIATTPIIFNVTSGNVDVTLTATTTTGDSLFKNIEVRDTGDTGGVFGSIIGKSETVLCVLSTDTIPVCTYPTGLSWDAQLPIPAGTKTGAKTGTITYTVTGPAPIV